MPLEIPCPEERIIGSFISHTEKWEETFSGFRLSFLQNKCSSTLGNYMKVENDNRSKVCCFCARGKVCCFCASTSTSLAYSIDHNRA